MLMTIEIPEAHKIVPSSVAILAAVKQVAIPRSAPQHDGQSHWDNLSVEKMGKGYLNYGIYDNRPASKEANGGRAPYVTRCSTRAQAKRVCRAVLAGAVFGASAKTPHGNGSFISGPNWCPGHVDSPPPMHQNTMSELRRAKKTGYECSIYTRASAGWLAGLITFEQHEAVMEPLREEQRARSAARDARAKAIREARNAS